MTDVIIAKLAEVVGFEEIEIGVARQLRPKTLSSTSSRRTLWHETSTSWPDSLRTGLLLAANAISTGYFIGEVGLLYRKWPGQMTSRAAHTDEPNGQPAWPSSKLVPMRWQPCGPADAARRVPAKSD